MIWRQLDRLSSRDVAVLVGLALMVGLFSGYAVTRCGYAL